ncbi:MAG: glycosyltransferase family 2 protein [Prosthecobacter sp.]|uniref:glycosyltransferase family 2 protein n=1 Tax=Prosthecobacter sp. TaxID=1965333 RepID=UPI0025E6680A|nr:glycosyltransferase family A protein [Prosthecobacter sp.]MCF7787337.1 glycosyltransferase family 2 protein [Prosthecobacter sp.]
MKISVVVPTCQRAQMLHTAVRSIQNQSRPDLIAEIIVSENSDAPESAAVCRECDTVTVKFCRQSPALRVVDHFLWLVRQAESEWVAWLADDDMWGRHHLAEAAYFLALHPDAVAFVSESVLVRNDSRTATQGFRSTLHSFLEPHTSTYEDHWVWGAEEMFVECMAQTPVNMWAMVVKKSVLLAAVEALVPSNVGYESDRIFLWRIATLGKIVVGREVTTFFRQHDDNASMRMWQQNQPEQERMTRFYIKQIIAEATQLGIPVRAAWFKVWDQLTDAAKSHILKAAGKASKQEIIEQWGAAALATTAAAEERPKRAGLLKCWVPPVIWALAGKLFKA